MTFKKFEFWLVTLASLIAVVVLSITFYEEYYVPYLQEHQKLPGLLFYVNTLGVRLGVVLLIYACFLFQNFFVFDRLYNRKKYDLVVVFTVLGLLGLLGGFYYLDSMADGLFRHNRYLPVTMAVFGGFLFYTFLKKVIQFYGPHLVPGPVKRKITGEVLLAFAVWAFIMIIIENSSYGVSNILQPFWGFWIPCAFFLIILNIYWVIPFHEKKMKRKGFFAYLLKASLIGLILCFLFGVPFADGFWSFFFFTSTQLLISIPIAWFFYHHYKERIEKVLSLKKELGKTNADLQFLRSQINPHFLFNALNTLYGTALQEKSERTAEGIQKLGDMMRFMLHENVQEAIPLEKEVEYLRNYIELQQLRTQVSDEIKIDLMLDEGNFQHMISPMLLIPFVENAFKHGISLKEKSWVKVSLSCREDKLFFDVYNSIHPQRNNDPEKHNSGIGLANVQQRLEMVYPDQHELIVRETATEFIVHLTITFEAVSSFKHAEDLKADPRESPMTFSSSPL